MSDRENLDLDVDLAEDLDLDEPDTDWDEALDEDFPSADTDADAASVADGGSGPRVPPAPRVKPAVRPAGLALLVGTLAGLAGLVGAGVLPVAMASMR